MPDECLVPDAGQAAGRTLATRIVVAANRRPGAEAPSALDSPPPKLLTRLPTVNRRLT
jgi:hypothetical protein